MYMYVYEYIHISSNSPSRKLTREGHVTSPLLCQLTGRYKQTSKNPTISRSQKKTYPNIKHYIEFPLCWE